MLNVFRRKDTLIRVVVGSILVLVCLTMVITLIPGITGMTGGTFSTDAVVAEVGGETIRAFELQQNLMRVSQMNRVPPEMMPLYTTQVLNQMILQKASLQEAERLGLRVAEEELRARLRENPTLFPNGTFVGQQQYEDVVAQQFGLSVAQFEQEYRNAISTEKLLQVVTDSVTVTPEEIRQAFRESNEKVTLRYVFLDPAEFRQQISVTDAALQERFERNRDLYDVPEKRLVKIIYVQNQKIRETTTVEESAARRHYEENKDAFRTEERVMVSHILLRAPEEDAAKVEEAKKKGSDLLEQLQKGADFATLATANSEDTGSGANGGDLGWIVRGQTVPPFEQAAFSLEPGSLSELVQTLYGIHILKVMEHEQARLKPFEEVKAEIEGMLVEEKVAPAVVSFAEQASAALRRSPEDIESVAEQFRGIVISPPPLSNNEPLQVFGPAPDFHRELFTLEKGQVGIPTPVHEGYAVPLLLDVFPAHPGEFAEVNDRVRQDYLSEEGELMALAKAEELSGLLQSQPQKDLEKAAASLKLEAKTTEPLTRQGSIPSVGSVRDLGPEAFSLREGETAGPVPLSAGHLIYQVASKELPKEEDLESQRKTILDQLTSQKRQLAFAIFQDTLRSRLEEAGELTIHDDAVSQLTAGFQF